MEQRVSMVTLGVADLARARTFYERLGWRGQQVQETVFFQAGGMALVLWSRAELDRDAGIDAGHQHGTGGVALAQNVRSEADVDQVIAVAEQAGAQITRRPGATSYGGYAGYFADPDGHLWEVAYNPGFPMDADGAIAVPNFGAMSDRAMSTARAEARLPRRRSGDGSHALLDSEVQSPGEEAGHLVAPHRAVGAECPVGIASSEAGSRGPVDVGFQPVAGVVAEVVTALGQHGCAAPPGYVVVGSSEKRGHLRPAYVCLRLVRRKGSPGDDARLCQPIDVPLMLRTGIVCEPVDLRFGQGASGALDQRGEKGCHLLAVDG